MELIVSLKGFDLSKHLSYDNNTAGFDFVFPLVFVVVEPRYFRASRRE